MSGHTPGPWSYTRNPENTRWIIDAGEAHAIACTAGYGPDSEDNARLIASAPELLEALAECQSILARLTGPDCDKESVMQAWAACVDAEAKARAAITKATGGQI